SDDLRDKAVVALSRVDAPTTASLEALVAQLGKEPLGRQATYGLGAMARRFRDAGNLGQAVLVRGHLEAALRGAREERQYEQVLGGIANSGDAYFMGELRKASTHEERSVRSLVVQGLKHQVGQDADDLLIAMLGVEKHKHVQFALIRVLQGRAPTDKFRAALDRFMKNPAVDKEVVRRAEGVLEQWQK